MTLGVRKVDPEADAQVRATLAYQSYESWSLANNRKPKSQTMFGRVLAQHFQRKQTMSGNVYLDIELHDVPPRPHTPRNPDDDGPDRS